MAHFLQQMEDILEWGGTIFCSLSSSILIQLVIRADGEWLRRPFLLLAMEVHFDVVPPCLERRGKVCQMWMWQSFTDSSCQFETLRHTLLFICSFFWWNIKYHHLTLPFSCGCCFSPLKRREAWSLLHPFMCRKLYRGCIVDARYILACNFKACRVERNL